MLGQVIVKLAYVFDTKQTLRSVQIPFGTILFVSKVEAGRAWVIYEETVYSLPFNALKIVDKEKDLLTWEQVLELEKARKLKNEEAINNLFVE